MITKLMIPVCVVIACLIIAQTFFSSGSPTRERVFEAKSVKSDTEKKVEEPEPEKKTGSTRFQLELGQRARLFTEGQSFTMSWANTPTQVSFFSFDGICVKTAWMETGDRLQFHMLPAHLRKIEYVEFYRPPHGGKSRGIFDISSFPTTYKIFWGR